MIKEFIETIKYKRILIFMVILLKKLESFFHEPVA